MSNKYFRSLSNRRCWLRNHVELREICHEFHQLDSHTMEQGKIPDPWDDFPRNDSCDCSWKRHRKHQWRVKKDHIKLSRPKVYYNSPWTIVHGYVIWFDLLDDMNMHSYRAVKSILKSRFYGKITQYRVRFAYRKHKNPR